MSLTQKLDVVFQNMYFQSFISQQLCNKPWLSWLAKLPFKLTNNTFEFGGTILTVPWTESKRAFKVLENSLHQSINEDDIDMPFTVWKALFFTQLFFILCCWTKTAWNTHTHTHTHTHTQSTYCPACMIKRGPFIVSLYLNLEQQFVVTTNLCLDVMASCQNALWNKIYN